MRKISQTKRKNFTLLELLAVIVVAAILTGLTLQMGKQSSIKQNARLLGSYIRLAQAKAVSNNIYTAAIVSQDDDGEKQIGVYRWYYNPASPNTFYITPDNNLEWIDISANVSDANLHNYHRRSAIVQGTSMSHFSGDLTLKNDSGTEITIDNASDKFAIFLFKPNGGPAEISGITLDTITITDSASEGLMKVKVADYSGKVEYE